MHLEADGIAVPAGLGWRLGLAAVMILISVVAGRIVPSFTRNWLAKRRASDLPSVHDAVDRIALGSLHAGLLGWVFAPAFRPIGGFLLLAAAFNLWRLWRWRGGATAAEPLLLVLHVGYAWLVFGAGLLGLAMLDAGVPLSAAVHALTVGTAGTMILAVMTRTTRGHTGRALSADRTTSLIYILVTLAAIGRVAVGFGPGWTMPLLIVSACFWIAAFGLFVL
jgi:uncharacterized protein involved in response to NO